MDDGYQVDISPTYFHNQIKGILEKNATKAIEVKALVFRSSGVASSPIKKLILVTSQCMPSIKEETNQFFRGIIFSVKRFFKKGQNQDGRVAIKVIKASQASSKNLTLARSSEDR